MGSAVVTEAFFKKDRGRFIGAWTLMVTLGVPASPFIFGFVTLRVGYRWIYYTLAIVSTSIIDYNEYKKLGLTETYD